MHEHVGNDLVGSEFIGTGIVHPQQIGQIGTCSLQHISGQQHQDVDDDQVLYDYRRVPEYRSVMVHNRLFFNSVIKNPAIDGLGNGIRQIVIFRTISQFPPWE